MQNRLIVFILFIMFLLQFSALKNPSMHPVGAADAMRIQRLEERLEDVVSTMAAMSDHLCSCNKKVCVS